MNWLNVLERAGWTFLQAALGAITTIPLFTDIEGWKALGAAGAIAGVGAVISLLKTIVQEQVLGPQVLFREEPLV